MPSTPRKPRTESETDFQKRLRLFERKSSHSTTDHPSSIIPMIRYVQVQTHSRCNADCVFCPYIESWHAAHPGRMSETLWQKILHDLTPFASGINKGKFLPYLMQEPLIDPSIFHKIRDIYTHFPTTTVELSTNGMALTPKVVDQLLDIFGKPQHKHQIWVSHHGIDADSFEYIMKLDYAKAHQNLIHLLQRSEGRLRIRLRGLGHERNGKHSFFTPQNYRDYWRMNFAQFHINPNNVQIDAYTFHDRAGTLRREERHANQFNSGIVRKIDPENRFYCPRIDLWVHIMWEGTIRLCCMDYHGEVALPNLQNISLLDYFQSEAYHDLYAQVTGQQPSSSNFICTRCTSPGG